MQIQCPACGYGYDFPVELATQELSVTCARCGMPFFVGRYGVRLPGARQPVPPTAPPTDGRHLDSGLLDLDGLEEALHQNIRRITSGAGPVAPEPEEDDVAVAGSLGAALFKAPRPKPSATQRLLADVHARPRPKPRPQSAPLPPPAAPGEVWTGPLPPLPRPPTRTPQPRRPQRAVATAPSGPPPFVAPEAPSRPPPFVAPEASTPPPFSEPEPPAAKPPPPAATPPPPPPVQAAPPPAPAAPPRPRPAVPAPVEPAPPVDPAVIAGFGAQPARVGGPPAAWSTGAATPPPPATPAAPAPAETRRRVPARAVGIGLAAAALVVTAGWWFTRDPAPAVQPTLEPVAAAPSAAPSAPASAAPASQATAPSAAAPTSEAPIPDMAPRHRPRDLREAFASALEGEQGKVLDIDCEELPCVLYGQVKDFADTVRLFRSPALKPYRTDRRFIYRWNASGGSGGAPAQRRFAIALMPREVPEDLMEQARQSVLRRYRQARKAPPTATP